MTCRLATLFNQEIFSTLVTIRLLWGNIQTMVSNAYCSEVVPTESVWVHYPGMCVFTDELSSVVRNEFQQVHLIRIMPEQYPILINKRDYCLWTSVLYP